MTLGILAAALAVVAPVVLRVRQDRWTAHAVQTSCKDLPAIPSPVLFGGLQAALALIAVASFAISIRQLARRRTGGVAVIAASTLLVGAVIVGATGALTMVDAPTSPTQGVDGSGIPCGSG
ncbi:hypothetical protein EEB19_24675 [Gordonia sp. OPL2]|nr:hypothetical protein EEB19_24675 [Gordonia sp. OPL2]